MVMIGAIAILLIVKIYKIWKALPQEERKFSFSIFKFHEKGVQKLLLAMVWMYLDTRDTEQIAATAGSIFWLVIPSLLLFVLLPLLLRAGWNFWLALLLSSVATALAYALMVWLLPRFGITL